MSIDIPRNKGKNTSRMGMQRSLSVVVSMMCLSGCQPMLTPAIQHQIRHVRIARIDDRVGQKMRQYLERSIRSMSSHSLYALEISLDERDRSLVLNRQGQCAIQQYILKARYTLSRLKDACVLARGSLRLYGVKPLTVSYYSQTVMDQASQDRALESAAERLIIIMAEALKKQPNCGCPIIPETDPKYESYPNDPKKG